MRRLNAGCETLRLTAAREKIATFFQGQKNHKAIWFQCYAKPHHSHPLRYTLSAALAGILRPFGRLTTGYAVSNVPFTQALPSLTISLPRAYTCSMRNSGVMTSKSASLHWQNFAFPGQVKETGYATGERAQGIAKAEAIVFDQHLHGFQQCFKTCNTDMG